MLQKSYENKSALYLIPTPIGNFDDITFRALKLLESVDYLLCEDTRVTRGLLNHFHISKKLVSCHEHNEEIIKEKICRDVKNGLNIGLVTDQGSPIISDPGYRVVSYLTENNVSVIALPGATAVIPSLMTSGIDSSHFLFYGFVNSKHSKRIKEFSLLKKLPYTLVFYEAVHRIDEFLGDMYDVFGNRKICICRELTKIHEEVFRGDLKDAMKQGLVKKGEFVIIVDGNKETSDFSNLSIDEHIHMYMEDGFGEKDAIKMVARDRGVRKSDIYKEYHIGK